MQPLVLTDPGFVQAVRSALAHLYDPAYLQNHPLSRRLLGAPPGDPPVDRLARAQQLRRLLLDAIAALRPEHPARSEEAHTYAVLTYRCVDGLSMEEIEAKLALSRRQAYREYSKGVAAVATHLWDQLQKTAPPPSPRFALAEAEADRLRPGGRAAPLLLADLLANVRKLLTPRLQQSQIQIHFPEVDGQLYVLADRIMTRQALLNLFSHALDSLPAQAALLVTVGAHSGRVTLQLAEAAAVHPLAPARPATKREGVGLAVAQSLIEAQGGQVRLGNLAERWQAEVQLPTAALRTVLVVDDNESMIALFQRYLGGYQLAVVGATSCTQAIDLASKVQPQAIVLDLMLPQQDGWDILQELQNNAATQVIPVIICSVLNEVALALAMGASDYVTKPVSQQELVAVLQRWLGVLQPAA